MIDFEAKLNVLKNILIEKELLLNNILNITSNQEAIFISSEENSEKNGEFFYEMNEIKQANINKITDLDTEFNKLFLSTPNFEQEAQAYLEKVKELQTLIKSIKDLDKKIRAAEESNKKYASKIPNISSLEEKRRQAIARDLLNKYKNNSLED
ncbi:MAG: hypothetical protein FWF50_04040 [Defluviitaleaceae bacterium]|nr:hypothetical protein [Defluviitaleaceae bacterium]